MKRILAKIALALLPIVAAAAILLIAGAMFGLMALAALWVIGLRP